MKEIVFRAFLALCEPTGECRLLEHFENPYKTQEACGVVADRVALEVGKSAEFYKLMARKGRVAIGCLSVPASFIPRQHVELVIRRLLSLPDNAPKIEG